MTNSIAPTIVSRLATLARPQLEARQPKDPAAVAEILRLAEEHDIDRADLSELTGLSQKTLRYYSQGKTSSGRSWGTLRTAMEAAGVRLVGRLRGKGKVKPPQAKKERAARAPAPVTAPVQPALAPASTPAPVAAVPNIQAFEVQSDNSIVVRSERRVSPNDPAYVDLLLSLLKAQRERAA